MDVKSFIKAARLRTLPLSISGIIIGSYLGVDYLNSIKGKIIDSTAKLGQQNFFIQECENKIKATLTSAEGRLSNLKDSYTTQDNEVRNFKLENNLNREPKSLTVFNIFIGLIVVAILFYIELEVNSNLLAPAMTSGKKEGMAIAAAVAGLNVFISLTLSTTICLKKSRKMLLNIV